MKSFKSIFIISFISLIFACKNQESSINRNQFKISLKSEFDISDTIILQRFVGVNAVTVDSLIIENKKEFEFQGNLVEEAFHKLIFKRNNIEKVVALNSNPLELNLTGNLAFPVFKTIKSDINLHFDELNDLNTNFQKKADSLNQAYILASNTNPGALDIIKSTFEKSQNDFNETVKNNIRSHQASIVSVLAMSQLKIEDNINFIDSTVAILKEKNIKSTYIEAFITNFDNLKSTTLGQVAPDFTLNTPDGKTLKLSSFRGKYILLDFWASWCGPCRRENPNLVQSYKKYKSDKFDIVGVSLDEDAGNWKQAIESDGLTWNHVSDLKGWESEAAKLYSVEAIPQSFLLNPEGKIIAKNLRGDELDLKLTEVLK